MSVALRRSVGVVAVARFKSYVATYFIYFINILPRLRNVRSSIDCVDCRLYKSNMFSELCRYTCVPVFDMNQLLGTLLCRATAVRHGCAN